MRPVRTFVTTRRTLPHWQEPGSTYSITWRTADSYFLNSEARTIVLNAIRFWDGVRWCVYATVVMPDHVHVLARPLPIKPDQPLAVCDLGQILHSVKGFSAQRINEQNRRTGSVWQDERYDRMIRDEREFEEVWGYILYNPVKTGLVTAPEEYPWLYQTGRAD